MREKKRYLILAFARTTDAMAMEIGCSKNGIPGRIIPVPAEISAGCGLAWRIPAENIEEAMPAIRELHIPIASETMMDM